MNKRTDEQVTEASAPKPDVADDTRAQAKQELRNTFDFSIPEPLPEPPRIVASVHAPPRPEAGVYWVIRDANERRADNEYWGEFCWGSRKDAKRFGSLSAARDQSRGWMLQPIIPRIVRVRPTASKGKLAGALRDYNELAGMHATLLNAHTKLRAELEDARKQLSQTIANFESAEAVHRKLDDAQLEKRESAEADRDAWKQKYEDLEIKRATCCVELEEENRRLRAELLTVDAVSRMLRTDLEDLRHAIAVHLPIGCFAEGRGHLDALRALPEQWNRLTSFRDRVMGPES